jgi:hypothetical protein
MASWDVAVDDATLVSRGGGGFDKDQEIRILLLFSG